MYEFYPELSAHSRKIERADYSHPIILGPGAGVLDGMHRLTKALIDGLSVIRAVRLESIPESAILGESFN